MADEIQFQRDGGVATITLNRPDAMNSLDLALTASLSDALSSCEHDARVRAVILTGSGTRAFCAGADVKALVGMTNEGDSASIFKLADDMHRGIILPIRRMQKVVIAAVNGVAVGGGLGVMLACDMRLAAADARIGVAYSNIAFSPDCGTSFFLPRLVGPARAIELYLFNELLSAEKAWQMGIVNRVVPSAELQAVAREVAERAAAGPPLAIGQTKQLIDRAFTNDLLQQLDDEARAIGFCSSTADHRAGLEAFQAKRKPEFKGR